MAVGPDYRSTDVDVDALLLDALAVEVAAADKRTKPSCRVEIGQPPPDARVAEAMAAAVSTYPTRPRPRPWAAAAAACPNEGLRFLPLAFAHRC